MTFTDYRTALLNAVADYQAEVGQDFSKRRNADMYQLRVIIQDVQYVTPYALQQALHLRIEKIRTGWWIFQTGHSRLKKKLLNVINDPQYAPAKIMTDEINKTQARLDLLGKQSMKLVNQLEKQQAQLIGNQRQLKIQQISLGERRYYFTYEDYIVNLLDKLENRYVLSRLELKQINWLLNSEHLTEIDPKQQDEIYQKLIKACKFALQALIKSIDYLVVEDRLQILQLQCLTELAMHYGQVLQRDSKHTNHLERLIHKLTVSYFKDGAEKTSIVKLTDEERQLIFAAKETLILKLGNEKQRTHIQPLCELRITNHWEAFKESCLEKGPYLSQWLKKTSRRFTGHSGLFKSEEVMTQNLISDPNLAALTHQEVSMLPSMINT